MQAKSHIELVQHILCYLKIIELSLQCEVRVISMLLECTQSASVECEFLSVDKHIVQIEIQLESVCIAKRNIRVDKGQPCLTTFVSANMVPL